MRVEPLKEPGMVGKDKVGQDIETRDIGKMARKNTAVVEAPVLKSSSNFNRARIPLTAELSDENQGARIQINQENYGTRMKPEFNQAVDNIKED